MKIKTKTKIVLGGADNEEEIENDKITLLQLMKLYNQSNDHKTLVKRRAFHDDLCLGDKNKMFDVGMIYLHEPNGVFNPNEGIRCLVEANNMLSDMVLGTMFSGEMFVKTVRVSFTKGEFYLNRFFDKLDATPTEEHFDTDGFITKRNIYGAMMGYLKCVFGMQMINLYREDDDTIEDKFFHDKCVKIVSIVKKHYGMEPQPDHVVMIIDMFKNAPDPRRG